MPKNWWFKFDFKVWRTDSDLRRCSFETRGFWLECLCAMHEADDYKLEGTYEELGWLVGCSPELVARCVIELQRKNTADVTLGHGTVTIVSRRLKRELSAREKSTLRKRKQRVTQMSHDRVISKSNKKEIREEREAASPPAPTPETEFTPGRWDHPAVVIFEELFCFRTGSGFASSVAAKVADIPLWTSLLENKRAHADKPLTERKKICNWILDEYDKRIQEKQNGTTQPTFRQQREADAAADFRRTQELRQRVANRDRVLSGETLSDSHRLLRAVEPNTDRNGTSG